MQHASVPVSPAILPVCGFPHVKMIAARADLDQSPGCGRTVFLLFRVPDKALRKPARDSSCENSVIDKWMIKPRSSVYWAVNWSGNDEVFGRDI